MSCLALAEAGLRQQALDEVGGGRAHQSSHARRAAKHPPHPRWRRTAASYNMSSLRHLDDMRLVAGQRLGPYEVLSPLGAGGMGEVYRARDARLGREVAVKVLPAERM